LIDLSGVRPIGLPQVHYDLDAVVAGLRASAASWVPSHFRNGKRMGDELRLANIRGDKPRKQGSCVIALEGERAGDWVDFDDHQGGGPLSTLEHATGLTGRALIEYAAELAGPAPVNGASHPIAESLTKEQRAENTAREIELILVRTAPLKGTAGEAYLAGRGLQVPDTPDLLFHRDLTYWDTRTGYPALIAIVRDAAGQQIAIHRTYLAPDCSGKADVPKPRMMLGSVAGGAVRLGQLGEHGVIGLAEGVETALSVMQACPALPVWAALSSGNLEQLMLPPEITRVVLLADHDGEGVGLKAAERAAARFHAEGRRVWIAHPPGPGDDFNDLLVDAGADRVGWSRRPPNGSRSHSQRTRLRRPCPSSARTGRSAFAPRCRRFPRCRPTTATSHASPIDPGACCSPRTHGPGSIAAAEDRPGSSGTTMGDRCRDP
jgi:hypothetical protein